MIVKINGHFYGGFMKKEGIKKIVLKAAVEKEGRKRLACAKAYQISQKHSVPLKKIGETCNENNIKIFACQLGCFK